MRISATSSYRIFAPLYTLSTSQRGASSIKSMWICQEVGIEKSAGRVTSSPSSSVIMWPMRRPAREELSPLATFLPPAFQHICQLLKSHLHFADLAMAKQVAVFSAIAIILSLKSFAAEYNIPRSGNTDTWPGAYKGDASHVVPAHNVGCFELFQHPAVQPIVSDPKDRTTSSRTFISAHLITLHRSLLTSHDLDMRS